MKQYTTIPHDVTAVQYNGSDASRDKLRELCDHWVSFTLTIPYITTGRGTMQVRITDWVVRCDVPGVFGFAVIPDQVFRVFYKELS